MQSISLFKALPFLLLTITVVADTAATGEAAKPYRLVWNGTTYQARGTDGDSKNNPVVYPCQALPLFVCYKEDGTAIDNDDIDFGPFDTLSAESEPEDSIEGQTIPAENDSDDDDEQRRKMSNKVIGAIALGVVFGLQIAVYCCQWIYKKHREASRISSKSDDNSEDDVVTLGTTADHHQQQVDQV